MHTQTRSAPARHSPRRHSLLSRFLGRIIAADTRYRETRKLRDMPDERLTDMGLARADVDPDFDQRLGARDLPQWPTHGW